MNYLVFLDPQAGELEKILSGTKRMLTKEFDPDQAANPSVSSGDSLYFLRSNGENTLRVKATVLRILSFTNYKGEDLSHMLKESQPKLQLTEEQYDYWSVKKQAILVEFDCAQKIDVMHIRISRITDQVGWIAFEEFDRIIE
jgi:hypothetical protein